MALIRKYVWVINTIRHAGEISLKELQGRWLDDEQISDGNPLPRPTFERWKDGIFDLFGIIIACTKGAGYKYYIENEEDMRDGSMVGWLLDTYDTMNTLSNSVGMRSRILVEDVPSSQVFLKDVVDAMRKGESVVLKYQGFEKADSSSFPVEPYCLRMFQRRWYMLAHSLNDDRMRMYALDRMKELTPTGEKFTLPDDFDARTYFSSYFGVIHDDKVKKERVVIRAYGNHRNYIRSLPMHASQREIGCGDGYADFELQIRPGLEFVMEVLRAGAMVEVMEPQSLRRTMHNWVSDLWRMYRKDRK